MMVTILNVITIISNMIVIMMKKTIIDLEDGVEPWIWFFQP